MNLKGEGKKKMMKDVEAHFPDAESTDWLDGVSIWFKDWWVNVRPSNTQPVLRLNIEADSEKILKEKTAELVEFIESHGGSKAKE